MFQLMKDGMKIQDVFFTLFTCNVLQELCTQMERAVLVSCIFGPCCIMFCFGVILFLGRTVKLKWSTRSLNEFCISFSCLRWICFFLIACRCFQAIHPWTRNCWSLLARVKLTGARWEMTHIPLLSFSPHSSVCPLLKQSPIFKLFLNDLHFICCC